MSDIIPYRLSRELPFAVASQLSEMPEKVQREFMREFSRRSKSVAIGYVMHVTLGLFSPHYLYLGKYLTQLLYWITLGGFGIWWLVDLVRMPSLTQSINDKIADECLRDVLIKHKILGKSEDERPLFANTPPVSLQPRTFRTDDDPTRLSVAELQTGFLMDYGLKTWQVKNEIQYDWENGNSEKEFKIASGSEILHILVGYEGDLLLTYVGSPINIFSINENLDKYILQNQSPPNILQYGDLKFYKESYKVGMAFNRGAAQTQGTKVLVWDLLDQSRRYLLRIEQTGRNQFRGLLANETSQNDFMEILPNK